MADRPHPTLIVDDVALPIVQAPMAGGPSTPELAIAVCEAGGLGFIAAGYRTPEGLREDIRELRSRTDRPFGVNLFAPGDRSVDVAALDAYLAELGAEADRYGVE